MYFQGIRPLFLHSHTYINEAYYSNFRHLPLFSITQNYICFRYDDSLSRYMEYDIHNNNNNETPAAWFVRELKDLSIEIEAIFGDQKPMLPLTLEQQNEHNNATICHICED